MATAARQKPPICMSFPLSMERRCSPKKINSQDWSLTDRQQRLSWWNQAKIRSAKILLVGAGGLGSNQGKILVQMGAGGLVFIDPDLVEDSNRNRQFFRAEDVGKPKAHQVIENLAPYATHRALLRGYFMTFEDWLTQYRRRRYTAICCGVDSLATMVAVARHGLTTRTPVVFTNVSEDGECCRIFIQRPGSAQPCFACYRPDAITLLLAERRPCVPVPAIADVLHVAVGFGTRAAIGEIFGVPIGDYNCRDISFAGIDLVKNIVKRDNCPLCGSRKGE